jgi:hypothetical protein
MDSQATGGLSTAPQLQPLKNSEVEHGKVENLRPETFFPADASSAAALHALSEA